MAKYESISDEVIMIQKRTADFAKKKEAYKKQQVCICLIFICVSNIINNQCNTNC